MPTFRLRTSLGALVLGLILNCTATAGDWLQWRGPLGTDQAYKKSVPLTWSKTENVKWRVALDAPGNSSPIVVGNNVFITHAPAESTLRGLHCYNRETGKLLWKHNVEYTDNE